MNEEIEELVIGVRANTQAFSKDIAHMRSELDGPLRDSFEKTSKVMETSLARAIRTGKVELDDLKRVAVTALAEIARAAVFGQTSKVGTGGGGIGALVGLAGGLLGFPGRATGGPVAPGRAYMVGEMGPELFVPSSSGQVEPIKQGGRGPVNITVNVNNPQVANQAQMARTADQLTRAVSRALAKSEARY